MPNESSRTVTVVVADGDELSSKQLVQSWTRLILALGQNANVRHAFNVNCAVNLAMHGGIGSDQANIVSLVGYFKSPAWKLPRDGGIANADSFQNHLRNCGFRRNIVALLYDVSLFSRDKFNEVWRADQFLTDPLKFAAEARELLGLK